MGLNDAVEGARHTGQIITWNEDGSGKDLTGATLTGRILNKATGDATDIDGTLTVTNASGGIFIWEYGAADVGTSGDFQVQFIATFSSSSQADKTFAASWRVRKAL